MNIYWYQNLKISKKVEVSRVVTKVIWSSTFINKVCAIMYNLSEATTFTKTYLFPSFLWLSPVDLRTASSPDSELSSLSPNTSSVDNLSEEDLGAV